MKYFHRIIFYVLAIISIIWACFALKTNPHVLLMNTEIYESIKLVYILLGTAVFWPMFYVEICDFIYSIQGKNGKLHLGHARFLQKDLVIAAVSAFILASVYWIDAVPYSFVGIDLGFVGIPFIVYAVYSLIQIYGIKIAGKPVNKIPVTIMLLAVIMFGLVSYSFLIKNSSGDFETYQALWFQLTILFGSFFIFTSTSMQLYFLQQGKLELSPFKKYFFKEVVRSRHKIYENMEEPIQNVNKKTHCEKAKHSARLRKKK